MDVPLRPYRQSVGTRERPPIPSCSLVIICLSTFLWPISISYLHILNVENTGEVKANSLTELTEHTEKSEKLCDLCGLCERKIIVRLAGFLVFYERPTSVP